MARQPDPLSTNAGTPMFNFAHIAKLVGTHMHYPTRQAWKDGVAQALELYWPAGQPMSIADEAGTGAVRLYDPTLGHANTTAWMAGCA